MKLFGGEYDINYSDKEMVKAARADGVICKYCDIPHDEIIAQVEKGETAVEMNGLGHTWACSDCKRKYH